MKAALCLWSLLFVLSCNDAKLAQQRRQFASQPIVRFLSGPTADKLPVVVNFKQPALRPNPKGQLQVTVLLNNLSQKPMQFQLKGRSLPENFVKLEELKDSVRLDAGKRREIKLALLLEQRSANNLHDYVSFYLWLEPSEQKAH